jgi:hypothetical protein
LSAHNETERKQKSVTVAVHERQQSTLPGPSDKVEPNIKATITTVTAGEPEARAPVVVSRQRLRAEEKFQASVARLQAIAPNTTPRPGQLNLLIFTDVEGTVDEKSLELSCGIETLIEAMAIEKEQRTRSQIVKDTMQGWYRATYPFAKLLLQAIQNDNIVRPRNSKAHLCLGSVIWSIWDCCRSLAKHHAGQNPRFRRMLT